MKDRKFLEVAKQEAELRLENLQIEHRIAIAVHDAQVKFLRATRDMIERQLQEGERNRMSEYKNLDFSQALTALKYRKKVARTGWNGKGMYIELAPGHIYRALIYEPFLVIKNVHGTLNTWVPSISDLFAEDWEVID